MRKRDILIVMMVFLTLSSLLIVLHDGYIPLGDGDEKIREFQRLALGLGLYASTNPRWGYIGFDPRVEAIDETNLFPIAGVYSYSPDRGFSVSDVDELH